MHGLLLQAAPTDKKIVFNKTLDRKTLCCKHAFSVSSECTLAYCMICKEAIQGSKENRGGRQRRKRPEAGDDGMVGTTVMTCDKGECGEHTEADLEDLEDHLVEDTCLRATRIRENVSDWELVAANCWRCRGLF